MSHDQKRRLSTGGLPPVKVREQYVVEQVSSHDSIPCYTAWMREEIVQVPQGWSASDFHVTDQRPQWSSQIYDTTPQAADHNYLKTLAEALHRETCEERDMDGRGEPDRIDVWGMPFAADASEEERIAACKAHMVAEVAARKTSGNNDFHVSELRSHHRWNRVIIIADQPEESWNEGEGGFLAVYWGFCPGYLGELVQPYGENHQKREISAIRYTRDGLGQLLGSLRGFF